MSDDDASRSADQPHLEIARNLFAILENADFYWGLATDDPKYKGVTANEQCRLAQGAYNILKENIDRLAKADKRDWTDLDVWGFVDQFASLLRRHVKENLPWVTMWDRMRKDIKQWEPVPDIDHFLRETAANLERLAGRGNATLAPPALSGQAEQAEGTGAGSDPAEAERAEGSDEQARQETIANLAEAPRQAYYSFEAVEGKAGKKLEDKEAYKLLKEEGIAEYELPPFDNWSRYLRQARQALNEQKHNRRRGRTHGKSIARQDQIEQPERDN